MNFIKPYLTKSICILSLLIALQSCSEKPGTWKNDQIDASLRDDFHQRNEQAIKLLKANDRNGLKMILCKELNEESYTNRLVELIGNQLNDNKFSIMDEYYVVNRYLDQDTIKATGSGIYKIRYPGTTREMYLVFFLPKDSKNANMITFVYSKFNYGWKISQLDFEPYSINGKTAPQLFKLAKENYSNHYLTDAINNLTFGITCLSPSPVWQYNIESDMHDFSVKLQNEANEKYKFPYTLNDVSTKPQIIRVYNESNKEGTYPMVYYLSKIKLADTTAIKKENEEVKRIIGKVMPGINKDKKYLYYSVFNEKPSTQKSIDHYDVVDKLQ